MKEEFNLSEKQTDGVIGNQGRCNVYQEEDVKEFIRLLKEELLKSCYNRQDEIEIINKLVGLELTKEESKGK